MQVFDLFGSHNIAIDGFDLGIKTNPLSNGIDGEQVEFDEELWSGLLDHICVKEDGQIVVVFKGGIEIGVGGWSNKV